MRLTILLPARTFLDQEGIVRVVAESRKGSFGILPRRMDLIAALVAGILTYETEDGTEYSVGLDEGILIKDGDSVTVCVREAVGDVPLSELKQALDEHIKKIDEAESALRSSIAILEGALIGSLTGVEDER